MKKEPLIFLASSVIIITLVFIFSLRSTPKEKEPPELLSCATNDFSGNLLPDERQAYFEGREIEVPYLAYKPEVKNVLGVSNENRWIEVDLSEQKLKAWDGSTLFLETPVSTGLKWTPTPVGEYRIWIKLRATKMSGGTGRNYYYLPNVPYVMYFYKGYGLHGTYWHNDFGTPRSHGCVNLPTPIAEKLFYWISPVLTEGKSSVRSTTENGGTRIVIHE
ncbi:hypothetical protein A2863_01655 [Candidatus Woesebacteria bacterium RIFCSPHIGHO2_01_FULL_38_9b]|uniref:L,D-TPase catalytic domain-containing protein n=1 Tax=Candidatus Woesebacteria bacterium RIFCSPHIGHO2_01_FULL_38_9b TaxID=1802493 RepID=A0A1F7Y1M2_9BACT|nr:MAG: hypothetical protein A2863_01655 [Candidatus Woesebacteria bacterium RIFCSPHIGHO2_01_FULL_38_9b]